VLWHRAEGQCPGAYTVDILHGGEEWIARYDPRVLYSTGGPISLVQHDLTFSVRYDLTALLV
jgi:hypothetical protein